LTRIRKPFESQGPPEDPPSKIEMFNEFIGVVDYQRTSAFRLLNQIAYVIALGPFFHILQLKFLPDLVDRILSFRFPDKRDKDSWLAELFSNLTSTVVGIGKFIMTGELNHLYTKPDKLVTFLIEAESLINSVQEQQYDFLDEGDTYTHMLAKISAMQIRGQSYGVTRTDFAGTQLRNVMVKLQICLDDFQADHSSRQSRIPSWPLAIVGPSGYGKTSLIAPMVLHIVFEVLGIPFNRDLIYAPSPGSEYSEGVHKHTQVFLGDDLLLTNAQAKEGNPFGLFMQCCDTERVRPNMAFGGKGMTLDPKAILLLSNFPDLGAADTMKIPATLTRRFKRWFVKWVGPSSLRKAVGIDVAKIDLSGPTWIFCRLLEGESYDADGNGKYGEVLTFLEFLRWCRDDFTEFRKTGAIMRDIALGLDCDKCPSCGVHLSVHPGRRACDYNLYEWIPRTYPDPEDDDVCPPVLFSEQVGRVEMTISSYFQIFVLIVFSGVFYFSWWYSAFLIACGLAILFSGFWRAFALIVPESLLGYFLKARYALMMVIDEMYGNAYSPEMRHAFLVMWASPVVKFQQYEKFRRFVTMNQYRILAGMLAASALIAMLSAFGRSMSQPQGGVESTAASKAPIPPKKEEEEPVIPLAAAPRRAPPPEQRTENALVAEGFSSVSFGGDPTLSLTRQAVAHYSSSEFPMRLQQASATFAFTHSDGMLTHTLKVHGINILGSMWVFPSHCLKDGYDFDVSLQAPVDTGFVTGSALVLRQKQIFRIPHLDQAYCFLNTPTRVSLKRNLVQEPIEIPFVGQFGRPDNVLASGTYHLNKNPGAPACGLGYVGPSLSSLGDCGTPLWGSYNGVTTLFGFLVGGDVSPFQLKTTKSTVGLFTPVTNSVVMEAFYALSDNPSVIVRYPPTEPLFHWQKQCEGVNVGPLSTKSLLRKFPPDFVCRGTVLGSMEPNYVSSPKISMFRTPFLGLVENPDQWQPARATTHLDFGYAYGWGNAYWTEYKDLCKSKFDIPILERAVRDYVDQVKRLVPLPPGGHLREMSIESAFRGIPGTTIRKLPASTSSGGLHIKRKKEVYYFSSPEMEDDDAFELTPEMNEAVRLIFQYERDGVFFPLVATLMPKMNEVLSQKKAQSRVARTIYNLPMAFNGLMRYVFAPLFDYLQQFPIETEMMLGVNAMGPQWGEAARFLSRFGGKLCADPDVSGADRINPDDVNQIAYWEPVREFCEWFGMRPSLIKLGCYLIASLTQLMVNFRGDIVIVEGQNPSGGYQTTTLNTFIMNIFIRYVYYKQRSELEALNRLPKLNDFRDNVSNLSYGDDGVWEVNPLVADWMNPLAYKEVLQSCSVPIKFGSNKDGAAVFADIQAVTFLKRKFALQAGGQWFCPLERSSIEKMLSWYEPSKTVPQKEQLAMILESAAREMFFHGFEEFTKSVIAFTLEAERLELPPLRIPSYVELTMKYDAGELRFW